MPTAQPLRLVVPNAQVEQRARTPTVLLAVQDGRLMRTLTRLLRASHVDLIACEPDSAPNWFGDHRLDLVIWDRHGFGPNGAIPDPALQNLNTLADKPPVISICDRTNPAELVSLFALPYANNVLARTEDFEQSDLLITARKLLENDVFGAEKYLHWGSVIHTFRLHRSTAREPLLRKLNDFLTELCCSKRTREHLETTADEFMMNAMFDAPVDAHGRHLYADQDRRTPVTLPQNQSIEVRFGSDGRNVVVSCLDPFGSLDPEIAKRSLLRGFRGGDDQINNTSGGAGIGLYMAFQHCHRLVINLHPGKKTEFIAVADASLGRKSLSARSLNIFTEESR